METKYSINKAKYHGFAFGISIAEELVKNSKHIDLKEALLLVSAIANGAETLLDPEKSYNGCSATTAKILRDGTVNSINVDRNHALDVVAGLSLIVDRCEDS